jgi:hypothetical protein
MTPRDFGKALQNQKDHLLAKVLKEDIEEIDAQFRPLRNAYRKEEGLKMRLEEAVPHTQCSAICQRMLEPTWKRLQCTERMRWWPC